MSETKQHAGPAPSDAMGADSGTGERKRILLVEGDGFTRLVLLLRLRLAGFNVDFTSNGTLGLGKLRSCRPDILLVELKLCGLSGLQLIKAARAEAVFGDRPIYVFTHVDRMNRATRKEVGLLATEVFDKANITREDLVQIFASTFYKHETADETAAASSGPEAQVPALSEGAVTGAIEELIIGVREQSELFVRDTGPRVNTGAELLSRVSSLASCAKAAGLPNLARHSNALENFLSQLCHNPQSQSEAALGVVTRAVEVMSRISAEKTKDQEPTRFQAVFADEAPYSNRAMEEALLNAGFEPACFEEPARARAFLQSNRTDIILANVVLPEGHGLSMADIRQIPLHVKTPVLFGPEATLMTASREDLPISAPRLDRAPVLLSEFVLRALNEVQSAGTSSPSQSTAPIAPAQALPTAPDLAAADGFELFARTPAQRDSTPTTVDTAHRTHGFEHLFEASGIPSQPILRAEPAPQSVDHEIEFGSRLPAAVPVDGVQVEDESTEASPFSSLQAQMLPAAESERLDETPMAAHCSQAEAVAQDAFETPFIRSNAEPNEFASAAVLAANDTENYGEVMNHRLEASPPEEDRHGLNTQRELAERVCAAETALYHAQQDIEQRDRALGALKNRLAAAGTNGDEAETLFPVGEPETDAAAAQSAQARCLELEQEVAALRQAFEGLNGGLSDPAQAVDTQRLAELEQQLAQSTAELEAAKAQQEQTEADLRAQVEAAKAAGQQTDAAREQAQNRCAELEKELQNQRQAFEALKSSAEQKSATPRKTGTEAGAEPWVGASATELEQQVRQGVTALAKATAELAKERGERQRSQQRAGELNSRLQALHQDLSRTLEAQREDLARMSALEEQHHQASQALERCTAELEQQQAERRVADDQLQKTKEVNAQLRKDLSFFEEANKRSDGARQELQSRLEASLSDAREHEARLQKETAERQRLADSLGQTQRELQDESRRRETLEQELQATREALGEREAKLQKEIAERQRLNQSQDSITRSMRDGPERDLEFSKLQSALQLEQVERKRQESQLARTRQSALEAAHAARTLRTGLRRQIREPVENLIQSARGLLELEMGEEQKKLAEAVLQDVLLVQTRLKEPSSGHGDSSDTTPPIVPAAK